jgi:hypothetical protein
MKFKYGTRRETKHLDTSDFVCYNDVTALRFELSSHRGGFLTKGAL